MDKPVYLLGFMGVGKTSLGKKLANKLNIPFVDTDQLLEDQFKMTISDYFKIHGEEAFRAAEREVLKTVSIKKAIIATGGGLPCFYDNMDVMNSTGITVFLDRPAKELQQRLSQAKSKRPLIADKDDVAMLEYIENELKSRLPFYQRAKFIVERDNQTANYIADSLVKPNKLL
ncbi:MAG: shikimate kinase [Brumimicrobium sp.]